ncbi:MAG: hypothetical protein ACMG57_05595, partial [Candidatus Dojkabacteria bacterium]
HFEKAIDKFLDYDSEDLRLLFFYLYFYIKVGYVDLETLQVTESGLVLDFEVWKNGLTLEDISNIQSPGDAWLGVELIGKSIKSPDKEKYSRLRSRSMSLFNVKHQSDN